MMKGSLGARWIAIFAASRMIDPIQFRTVAMITMSERILDMSLAGW